MYSHKFKKPRRYDFNLIIIGSGAGGGLAAHLAAGEGKRVCLIEPHALGGENLVSSSIPTKALLKTAETLDLLRQAPHYGIKASNVTYNYHQVLAWQEKAIASTGARNELDLFRSQGISIIKGHAHFINPWTVSVGQRRYCAERFIIATGSSPAIPAIAGLHETGYITYRQAFRLPRLPRSLFIIGGGAIAYEYAHIFSSLGVKVLIGEAQDHLLPGEDPEVSDSAEASLSTKGVRVVLGAKIVSVAGNHGRKVITFDYKGQERKVVVEEIMVAVGKLPNIDIGLENTGVHYSKAGIRVNRFMQTSQKHLYAVGDVASQFGSYHSHTAIQEARTAVHNLYHNKKIAMDYTAVPRCIFGMPEIAVVGKTEREMIMLGMPYQTALVPIGIIGKAMTNNYTGGLVKIIATHSGILLGASIVAPTASEMLQELTFAIQHHQHACAISKTIHPFPTWSEAIRVAADKIKCI
jgi:pyruvate/2-oxoglutarate dehydrogenase complex dihydrolipoamide dehydrogenase (E3) component